MGHSLSFEGVYVFSVPCYKIVYFSSILKTRRTKTKSLLGQRDIRVNLEFWRDSTLSLSRRSDGNSLYRDTVVTTPLPFFNLSYVYPMWQGFLNETTTSRDSPGPLLSCQLSLEPQPSLRVWFKFLVGLHELTEERLTLCLQTKRPLFPSTPTIVRRNKMKDL